MRFFLMTLIIMSVSFQAHAEIITENITYQAGETEMIGFLAYDDEIEGQRPGVLVVHEWWGHNEHAQESAKKLAELGFTAFALDMYGQGKMAEHPEDAGAFATEITRTLSTDGKARFMAAMNVLQKHDTTDPKQIAAIGYCFGGGIVLHMARYGLPLKGVVSFHGGLGTDTPAVEGKVKARVLVCHGADDKMITPDQVESFKAEMDNANVDYIFESYKGATHSFTNPRADELAKKFGIPIAYHQESDTLSWKAMTDFLNDIFDVE